MEGYAHWYNLDLPETMAVRARLLPENGRISQIAMSAMEDWGGEIKESDAPVLVIIEGLTMYLSEADVRQIFAVIAGRFARAEVFVEVMNPMIVKRFREKSIEGSHAKFTWGIKDGRALAALLPDFRFLEEHGPGGGDGGNYAGLPMAGKNSACPQYFQQNPCAGEVIAGIP